MTSSTRTYATTYSLSFQLKSSFRSGRSQPIYIIDVPLYFDCVHSISHETKHGDGEEKWKINCRAFIVLIVAEWMNLFILSNVPVLFEFVLLSNAILWKIETNWFKAIIVISAVCARFFLFRCTFHNLLCLHFSYIRSIPSFAFREINACGTQK